MKVKLTTDFKKLLGRQVNYISSDKPRAARKFKLDLIFNLKKDLVNPFSFQKSKYFDDENIRDYVFKGYTTIYKVEENINTVTVFGFIKYKESL